MATIKCILAKNGDQVNKTFQIVFDKNDKIKIFGTSKELAIKGINPHARKALEIIRNGTPGRNAVVSKLGPKSKSNTKNNLDKKNKLAANVYLLPLAPGGRKPLVKSNPPQIAACFSPSS